MQSLVASPVQSKPRGGRDPQTAILSMRADGTIGALSSDSHGIYTVRLSPLSCTCPGFVGHGHCYHSTAAVERFSQPPVVCWSCGAVLADGGVLRTNGRHYCADWDHCHARILAVRRLYGAV